MVLPGAIGLRDRCPSLWRVIAVAEMRAPDSRSENMHDEFDAYDTTTYVHALLTPLTKHTNPNTITISDQQTYINPYLDIIV